jgi:glutamate dehydrogenase
MALVNGLPSVMLSNVEALIKQKVDDKIAPLVAQFTQLLYGNISSLDLEHRNESDMYGAALSLWSSLNEHKDEAAVIHVFNPSVSKNGWKSSHTIIEIIIQDMPFLVDSIRIALNRLGLSPHLMLSATLKIIRDDNLEVTALTPIFNKDLEASSEETVFFIEIDRQANVQDLDMIKQTLLSVVEDIRLTVVDWQPMLTCLNTIISDVEKSKLPGNKSSKAVTLKFLRWIADSNFTLMGYRSYDVKSVEGDIALQPNISSSLGLMKNSQGVQSRLISSLSETGRDIALGKNHLILTKTNSNSRVHRPAQLDYIGIKRFDEQGTVIAEERFIGLFGSAYYTNSALDLPLISDKVMDVCDASPFAKGTHNYKALINILETYPRDEILQSSVEELLQIVTGILQMQERDYCGLFMRRDAFDRFYSFMVYVPRERYNTKLRMETQRLLQSTFDSEEEVTFTTFFSESVHARTHYIVRVNSTKADIDVKEIEKNVNEAARNWDDKLVSALRANQGESLAKAISQKYLKFPQSYKDEVLPGSAIVDIEKLEKITANNPLEMLFYQPVEEKPGSRFVKLKLFHKGEPIHLSDVLPRLENFGLRVIGERPYAITTTENQTSWILDFSMYLTGDGRCEVYKVRTLFQDAFAKVWRGDLEDDGFNRLILGAGIEGREVSILRAFAKYERQIGGRFSQHYIENTFSRYPEIAKLLINLFINNLIQKIK